MVLKRLPHDQTASKLYMTMLNAARLTTTLAFR
jgi:hypothetical protein